jgi:heat shock protein HtpX
MFQQIESNKRQSVLLVIATAALLMLVGWAIGSSFGLPWYVGVSVALAIAVIAGCVSYYGGGRIVLTLSGAREIQKADNPRLFNVVEEMSIAAGLPMPRVYMIDDSAPNAFATGRKPEEAAICVTSGLVDKLNRDELTGVIAHETSHIRNYDILFMTMMAVMVGSIALMSDAFLRATWYGGGRSRGRGRDSGGGLIVLLALVLAILAPIAAKLVELAASRRREYLADASGALLTRYPAGLASALSKIAADPDVLEAANRATQHMYIVNPLKGAAERTQSLWSTHPPIMDRIERLQRMAFAGAADATTAAAAAPAASAAATPAATMPAASAIPGAALTAAAAAGAAASVPTAAAGQAAPAEASACPRCSEPLVRAKLAGRDLRACRACGGLWMGRHDAMELLKTDPKRLAAADARFPNLVGTGWQHVGAKRCPQCGGPLTEGAVKGVQGVTVDQCPKCDGVWFDDGELAALAAAAEGQAAS